MSIYEAVYDGLRDRWLRVDDLGPLAGVQVWVAMAQPCNVGAEPTCANFAVHVFGADGTDTLYHPCDPDGPAPAVTGAVGGLRAVWPDGHAERLGAEAAAYLHPVVARRRPQP